MNDIINGDLTVYAVLSVKDIDGKRNDKKVIVQKFYYVTEKHARGLFADVLGMNDDQSILHAEWKSYSVMF